MSTLLHLAACEKSCVPGPAHCEGNVVVACTSRGKNPRPLATRRDCESETCIETNDTAFCARDPSPAPECESPDSAQSFCAGTDIVGCESGYTVTQESCSTGQICVALGTSGDPACVEASSEGTCPDDVEGSLCVGEQALRCSGGYVLSRATCSAPDLCHTPTASTALCFVEGKPSCDSTVRHPTHCVADALAWCDDGVLVHGPPCSGSCNVVTEGGSSTAECSD